MPIHFLMLMESVPATDMVERKHGKWIIDRAFGNDVMSNEQMAESPKGVKERYCRLKRQWCGTTLCCSAWESGIKTNADKIRSATDEQLAEMLTTVNRGRISAKEYLYWLRQECKT